MSESRIQFDQPEWVRWAVFIGPLLAFFLLGLVIPAVWERIAVLDEEPSESPIVMSVVTTFRVVLMLGIIGYFSRILLKCFPISMSWLGVAIGFVGGVCWIAICVWNPEAQLLKILGISTDYLGIRDAINPWELYSDSFARNWFLFFRFTLLVVAVPIAEELMLRGFLIRAVESEDWERQPLSQVGRTGCIVATLYGVFSHPSEIVAAVVWFSLVTWLMKRTGKFWDCVMAHAITNAMLGAYIVYAQDWRLW